MKLPAHARVLYVLRASFAYEDSMHAREGVKLCNSQIGERILCKRALSEVSNVECIICGRKK